MKKTILQFKPLGFIVILGIILNSCCTKKDCVNAFDMRSIKLTGFTKQESEQVLVSSYVQGEGFLNLVASDTTSAKYPSGNENDELIIFVPIEFKPNLDYIIQFKSNELVYKISDIKTTMKKCNTCFLTEDNYLQLSGYKVNGQQISNFNFELEKN
jgi:hypothetical protein